MQEYVDKMRQKIGHDPLILMGSNVIIQNSVGKFLLQQRQNGNWGLLGGLNEWGESLEETTIREVKEESGLTLEKLRQIHTFSGSDFIFKLANQDQIQVATTLFYAEKISGKITLESPETLALHYFSYENLPVTLENEYRLYIDYYRQNSCQR